MSTSQVKPKETRYGKVHEICERLGYQSKIKNDRHVDVLRHRTVAYRVKFIDSSPGQRTFPLQYDAMEVQSCASSFLATYPELFSAQSPTSSTPCPVLPQDKDFIRDEIAKLLCTQHSKWLQNTEYANAKRLRDADQERDTSQTDDDDSGIDDNPKVNGSSNGGGHAIWVQSDLVELSSGESDESDKLDGDSSDQERLRIEKNIGLHLNYAYPLDNSKDGKNSEWIFSSNKWPADVEPFAFRYLHERNLYNGRTENMEALNKFSKDFIQHMGLECTEVEEKMVFKKCEGLVQRIARKWHRDYCFLMKTKNILRKTPVFQKAWNAHRLRWLAKKDNGRSGHLIEIPQRETPLKAPNAKRSIDFMTPETGHSMREQPPPKRMAIGVLNQSFQEGIPETPITRIGDDSTRPLTVYHPAAEQNPSKNEKAPLHFLIENERGIPDSRDENIVSGTAFRDTTLEDFFKLVSKRSGKPLAALTSLTFRYDWGNQFAELFLKGSGEDAWRSFKTDVINYFRLSRAERPKKEVFHVWVRCGDTITVGDAEEDNL